MKAQRSLFCALLFCVLPFSMASAQSPDQDREAALFGGEGDDAGSSTASSDEEGARDKALFGSGESIQLETSESIDSKLEEAGETLEMGGTAYLRLMQNFADSSDPDDDRFSSPNLLDLYLDARRSENLRFFTRARMSYNATAQAQTEGSFGQSVEPTSVDLDQFWMKFNIDRKLFVTAGKQPIKWGAGRFWNPTDFLNQQRRDPLAIFDRRLGQALLKLHLPIESLGWNFYAVGNFESVQRVQELGVGLRLEMVFGLTEVTISGAGRASKRNSADATEPAGDAPLRIGADISSALGPFDVWLEAAAIRYPERSYWTGEFDFEDRKLPDELQYTDDWVLQAVTGFEFGLRYSDQDTVYFGGEYFYNDGGYSDADLYPWLIWQGEYVPFYVGKNYASAYMLLYAPGDWNDSSFVLSGIGNLSDGSYVGRFDYQLSVLTHLSLNLYAAYHFGADGEFFLPLDIPGVELTEEQVDEYGLPEVVKDFIADGSLAEGTRLAAPLVDLGLWLRMSF